MDNSRNSSRYFAWLTLGLVFLVPAFTLTVRGGANGSFFLLLAMSLGFLLTQRDRTRARVWPIAIGFALFPVLIIIGFSLHHKWLWPAFDAPSRFLFAIPIALYLLRRRLNYQKFFRYGCMFGAVAAAGWSAYGLRLAQSGSFRVSDGFTNTIPFSCIALILGFCAISLEKENRLLKVASWICCALGLYVAYHSQSRAALPFMIAATWAYVVFSPAKLRYKVIGALVFIFAVGMTSLLSPTISSRLELAVQQITQLTHKADRDTSIGIRSQLWHAAIIVFRQHPVLGVGKGEFHASIQPLSQQGIITPVAAAYPHPHNELLYAAVELGVLGPIAILLIYLGPGWYFWKRRRAADLNERTAALQGLLVILGYAIYGIADCMFTTSMQIVFYAASVVILYCHLEASRAAKVCEQGVANSALGKSESKSVLILSHNFNVDGRAASLVITDKIPFLLDRAIVPIVVSSVTGAQHERLEHYRVLSWGPDGLRSDLRLLLKRRLGGGMAYRVIMSIISILVLPFRLVERLTIGLQAQWSWFPAALVRSLRILRHRRVQAIYSTGGPYSAHWAGYWLSRLTGIPWLAEIHDPMLRPGAPCRTRNERRMAKIEAMICQKASLAWWFTEGALASARKRHPELGDRGFAFAPGAPPPALELRSPPGPPGEQFNIAYFGTLSDDRGLMPAVSALELLLQTDAPVAEKIKFHIYGGDLDRASESKIHELNFNRYFEFHGRLTRDESVKAMARNDALLLLHGDNPECSEYIPQKFYEYLWLKRPIIALTHCNTQFDSLLHAYNHYAAPSRNIPEVAKLIETAYLDWKHGKWRPAEQEAIGPDRIVDQIAAFLAGSKSESGNSLRFGY